MWKRAVGIWGGRNQVRERYLLTPFAVEALLIRPILISSTAQSQQLKFRAFAWPLVLEEEARCYPNWSLAIGRVAQADGADRQAFNN